MTWKLNADTEARQHSTVVRWEALKGITTKDDDYFIQQASIVYFYEVLVHSFSNVWLLHE
jgi:hypothetical protein